MYSTKHEKQNQPTPEQFQAYQALFDYFNRTIFMGKLPAIFLNFSRKNNCAGFFAPERWKQVKGTEHTHEISLNPVILNERSFISVCSTLVHEQAHLWQHIYGKPSRTGYHNKQWADKMEAIGLMPSDTGNPDGKKVGQRMTHYIITDGPFELAFKKLPEELFLPWRANEWFQAPAKAGNGEGGAEEKPTPKPKSKIKYTCPNCGVNIWGKPGLQVGCLPCKIPMKTEDDE